MALTKLEAVNIVLDAIGESPVSSLTSGLPDAEAAESKLDEVRVEILSRGWHQNIEKDVTLKRDANNEILLSNIYLRVDSTGADKSINVVQRYSNGKRKLFDIKNRSYTFTNDLVVDIIVDIPFDELTVELQNYIAARAARKFQESSEAENEDNNIIKSSPHVSYATYRFHPSWGR